MNVTIHYCPETAIDTACGSRIYRLSYKDRLTDDLASVDCKSCLASDEVKAALMEDALITLIDSQPPADLRVLRIT